MQKLRAILFVFWLPVSVLLPLLAAAQTPTPDHLVLHPNGFGEHSYAAWKAQVGLQDTNGNANHALYFQKMTSTPTFAAGVAVIQGVEGLPVSALTGLSWYIRDALTGGDHCGAGAPRWNVRVKPPSGASQTLFFGCAAMLVTGTQTSPDGHMYEQRTTNLTALSVLPSGTVITALSILFDEGDDVGSGFAHLDNITVTINGIAHVWTSPSDNSN